VRYDIFGIATVTQSFETVAVGCSRNEPSEHEYVSTYLEPCRSIWLVVNFRSVDLFPNDPYIYRDQRKQYFTRKVPNVRSLDSNINIGGYCLVPDLETTGSPGYKGRIRETVDARSLARKGTS